MAWDCAANNVATRNPRPPSPAPVSGPFHLFFGEQKSTPGDGFTFQKTIDFYFLKNKSGEPVPSFCFEKKKKTRPGFPNIQKPRGMGPFHFLFWKNAPKGSYYFFKIKNLAVLTDFPKWKTSRKSIVFSFWKNNFPTPGATLFHTDNATPGVRTRVTRLTTGRPTSWATSPHAAVTHRYERFFRSSPEPHFFAKPKKHNFLGMCDSTAPITKTQPRLHTLHQPHKTTPPRTMAPTTQMHPHHTLQPQTDLRELWLSNGGPQKRPFRKFWRPCGAKLIF